jgi:hypothetical protein
MKMIGFRKAMAVCLSMSLLTISACGSDAGQEAQCQTAGPECGDGFTSWMDMYLFTTGRLQEVNSFDVLDPNGVKCSMTGLAFLERVSSTR